MAGVIAGTILNKLSEGTSWETPAARQQRLAADAQIASNRKVEAEAIAAERKNNLLAQFDEATKKVSALEQKMRRFPEIQEIQDTTVKVLQDFKVGNATQGIENWNPLLRFDAYKQLVSTFFNGADIVKFEAIDLDNEQHRDILKNELLQKADVTEGEIQGRRLERLMKTLAQERVFFGVSSDGSKQLGDIQALAMVSNFRQKAGKVAADQISSWNQKWSEKLANKKALKEMLLATSEEKTEATTKAAKPTEDETYRERRDTHLEELDTWLNDGLINQEEYNTGKTFAGSKDWPKNLPFNIRKSKEAETLGENEGNFSSRDMLNTLNQDKAFVTQLGQRTGDVQGVMQQMIAAGLNPSEVKKTWDGFFNWPQDPAQPEKKFSIPEKSFTAAATVHRVAQDAAGFDIDITEIGQLGQTKEERRAVLSSINAVGERLKHDSELQAAVSYYVNSQIYQAGGAAKIVKETSETTSAIQSFMARADENEVVKLLRDGLGPKDNIGVFATRFYNAFGYENETDMINSMKVLLTTIKDNGGSIPAELEGVLKGNLITSQPVALLFKTFYNATRGNIGAIANLKGGAISLLADGNGRAMLKGNYMMLEFLEASKGMELSGQKVDSVVFKKPQAPDGRTIWKRGKDWVSQFNKQYNIIPER